jgi:hypothetical protein
MRSLVEQKNRLITGAECSAELWFTTWMFLLIICNSQVNIINPLRAENNPIICAKRAGRQVKVWRVWRLAGRVFYIEGTGELLLVGATLRTCWKHLAFRELCIEIVHWANAVRMGSSNSSFATSFWCASIAFPAGIIFVSLNIRQKLDGALGSMKRGFFITTTSKRSSCSTIVSYCEGLKEQNPLSSYHEH